MAPEIAERFCAVAGSLTPAPAPTASTRVPCAFTALAEKMPFSISRMRLKFPGPSAGWE